MEKKGKVNGSCIASDAYVRACVRACVCVNTTGEMKSSSQYEVG